MMFVEIPYCLNNYFNFIISKYFKKSLLHFTSIRAINFDMFTFFVSKHHRKETFPPRRRYAATWVQDEPFLVDLE